MTTFVFYYISHARKHLHVWLQCVALGYSLAGWLIDHPVPLLSVFCLLSLGVIIFIPNFIPVLCISFHHYHHGVMYVFLKEEGEGLGGITMLFL